jgi:HEAT repeat protein
VCQAAARAYGQLPDADSLVLIHALSHRDPFVRLESVWALGRMKTRSALGNLIGILQGDDDCRVRGAAAWALGVLGDELAMDALRRARQNKCRLASQAAVLALENF